MNHFPKKLKDKLENRKKNNALRNLGKINSLADFSSNDYLGFSKSKKIFEHSFEILKSHDIEANGSTGSRLLTGNHRLYNFLEDKLTAYHNCENALVYNSGYDANIGFFSSIPLRGDIILFDELIHASIRDGITMSNAKSYKFRHNDLADLETQLLRHLESISESDTIYIVTESVFSMDGDSPDLISLSRLCKIHNALLVIDEAHALGVFGNNGKGLINQLHLENSVFARIVTFGKALGCHGAAILCSDLVKQYLINFSRSFIYTTALPPHSIATILSAYMQLSISENLDKLQENINFFKTEVSKNNLEKLFIASDSAIQCCIISGNEKVKSVATKLQSVDFDVKPILSPTIPINQERLRFCLHAYNTRADIENVLQLLAEHMK